MQWSFRKPDNNELSFTKARLSETFDIKQTRPNELNFSGIIPATGLLIIINIIWFTLCSYSGDLCY